MSFNENLQNLRSERNMTQEELADKLEVSRQAVSKWESGSGYPEMDKIMLICEIFNCSMDTLMKGKISLDNTNERKNYDNMFNKFSKGIALGVGVILLGVTILIGLATFTSKINNLTNQNIEILGVVILLFCILIAVPIFVYLGIEMENFKKKNLKMPNIYSEEEVDGYNRKFAIVISACIASIIFGVIILIILYGINIVSENSTLPVAILLGIITISVPLIIHHSIQLSKYNIKQYNKESDFKISKENEKVGRISGVIMLSATFIFLLLGFIWQLWHIAWVVFPLGGILCGIIGTLFAKTD